VNRLSSEAVRFGSFADISQCKLYVRFYLQERTLAVHQRMSRPRADISDMSGWEAIEDESYALPCRGGELLTRFPSRPLSRQAINITITWFLSARLVLNVTVEIFCTRRKFAIFIDSGLL